MKKIFILLLILFKVFCYSDDEILIIAGDARANPGQQGQPGGLVSFIEYLANQKTRYFLADCGNIIDVNRYTLKNHGSAMYNLFEKAGLKVLSPANHDFDYGIENFLNLTPNINVISTNSNIGNKYVISEINGIRILFLGFMRSDVKRTLSRDIADNIILNDFRTEYLKIINENQGKFDTVIALSNASETETARVFSVINGIDYVFYIAANDFNSITYLESTLRNGTKIYAIPSSLRVVWEGRAKDKKFNFNFKLLDTPSTDEFITIVDNLPSKKDIHISDKNLFIRALMSYLRKETESDAVLLNHGTFKTDMDGFQDFLRYDNPMHKVYMRGDSLQALLSRTDLIVYGLDRDSDGYRRIFNRYVIADYEYTVLVNDFLFQQKELLKIPMKLKKENVLPSIKQIALDNINLMEQEHAYFKPYMINNYDITVNFSDLSGWGQKALYQGVSKIYKTDQKTGRLIFNNYIYRECKIRSLSNTINYRQDKRDNDIIYDNIRIDTNLKNKLNSLSVVQRIDLSLLKNTAGDQPLNYRLSLGNDFTPNFYAGLSYQQVFPRKGKKHHIGIQLTGKNKEVRPNGLEISNTADIFYSNSNRTYYEGELKNNFRYRIRQSVYLDFAVTHFTVYDENIGKRAYSSEYFLGFNRKFVNRKFIR
ncbi:MAG: hypothetical protein WC002_00135 [Candidatus Muiribacteriota bacterium]